MMPALHSPHSLPPLYGLHAVHAGSVIWAVIMVPVGFAFGLAYFAMLRAGCARLSAGRRGALMLTGTRMAAAVSLLTVVAHHGGAALLALFAGFLLARSFAVRSASVAARGRR